MDNMIYRLLAIVIAMSFHELSHAFISHSLGDPLPKRDGRLTLNPIKHIDPLGALMIIVAGFGWAKPVMVNPDYYEDRKFGMVVTAFAGPLSNFVLAFICIVIMRFFFYHPFLEYLMMINIVLGVFNMFPIPPLDGSKVFGALLPEDLYFRFINFQHGFIILIFLMITGSLSPIIMGFVGNIQAWMIGVVNLI